MNLAIAALVLLAGWSTPLAAVAAEPVPSVGCPSDGMMGPVAAPTDAGHVPSIGSNAAHDLAYYWAAGMGVLAPREWHCFNVYGSSGSILFVTPERHDDDDLSAGNALLGGEAIELSYTNGTTSGRFEVAEIVPRLFPRFLAWVRTMKTSGDWPGSEFLQDHTPYRNLVHQSPTRAEFTIDARNASALWRFTANADPVSAASVLRPDCGMDVVQAYVRLSPASRHLTPTIIATMEREATHTSCR